MSSIIVCINGWITKRNCVNEDENGGIIIVLVYGERYCIGTKCAILRELRSGTNHEASISFCKYVKMYLVFFLFL